MAGIRLTVLDDGLFVRTQAGDVRPLAATFHRFVAAVAQAGPFEHVRYLVPVRDLRIWEVEPALEPVDESVLQVVPTAFFSGIGDYLLRAGWVGGRNWRPIEQAVADSDLLWLRLPASNALLALAAARRHGVPYFGWLAGSVESVARAQQRPWPLRLAARWVGAAYDAVSELAREGGPTITLDAELFASVVTTAEVTQTRSQQRPANDTGLWRLVWAGRMAGEKGLVELVGAVELLLRDGRDVSLALIGDGPARPSVERAAARLPTERVAFYGHVGDRATYMALMRDGDLFVHPSQAEGVPKVLVEAMAAGVPIVAVDSGAVSDVLGDGERGFVVASADGLALADAIGRLLADPWERWRLRERGLEWAADHTAEAQARRLVEWLRERFPKLDWPE